MVAFGQLLIDTCPASDELHDALRHLTDTVQTRCHAAIARYPDRLPSREPLDPAPVPPMAADTEVAFIAAHSEAADVRLDTVTADDPALAEVDLDALDSEDAVLLDDEEVARSRAQYVPPDIDITKL